MDHAVVVHILEAHYHAGHHELSLLLVEALLLANVIAEITSAHQIANQVEVLPVLEGIVHIDEEAIKNILPHSSNYRIYSYGCLSCAKSFLSFITEFTLRLVIILALDISFMA
jgi:hypothetical protein